MRELAGPEHTRPLSPNCGAALPIVTYLNTLDKEALAAILTEPRNALAKQYKKLFRVEGIELSFTPDAVDYIVDKALEYKLGARGSPFHLRGGTVDDAMFNLPSANEKTFVLTREYCAEKLDKSNIGNLKSSLKQTSCGGTDPTIERRRPVSPTSRPLKR